MGLVFNKGMKHGLFLFLLVSLGLPLSASAYEMQGMISYNISQLESKPSNFSSSGDGIGYTFLGRFDLGPGQVESGFLFTPTSIATTQTTHEAKFTGTYWIFPLLYRFTFFPPFYSFGIGADYAVVGTSNLIFDGNPLPSNNINSGYLSHFGAQASLQATQDLGENLGIVLDLRYRKGLGTAISVSGADTKYSFFIIALGIQKHLD